MEDEHLSGFKLLAEASKPCIKIESHSYKVYVVVIKEEMK